MWSIFGSSNSKPCVSTELEKVITQKQRELLTSLCSSELKQSHLFQNWTYSTADDVSKLEFVEQLEHINDSYPTGIVGYLKNARVLLLKSKEGINSLDGWKATVPVGHSYELGTDEYKKVEKLGQPDLGFVGFVLVAGGLGERLGYGDIKLRLPIELASESCYLAFYIEYILAAQENYAPKGKKLPLCIMTSAETNAGTIKLLEENSYFGMLKEQITIVQQGTGVPALLNNDAKIALKSKYKIMTKPHGHGDVHALLYSHQIVKKWVEQGIKWISFFQDTNALGFHSLSLALGASKKFGLVMNSMTIPRKAKQAIGAIVKLTNTTTQEVRTVNVEYNQLDPLLRASGYPNGDFDDKDTGFSPFPGNINHLLFCAKSYIVALEKSKGIMPESVNPKYTDTFKNTFQKPTRLECMMQDFPLFFEGLDCNKVGFTSIEAGLCYSPVKNTTAEGVKLQKSGIHPGVAASGEADQYAAHRKILKSIGVRVEEGEPETHNGITIVGGPAIVIKPSSLISPGDYTHMFPYPNQVSISKDSSLVIMGAGELVIESLRLEGSLVVDCQAGAYSVISDVFIKNEGWKRVPAEEGDHEVILMRGYSIEKIETCHVVHKKDDACLVL